MDDQAVIKIDGKTDLPEGTPDRPLVTFALFAYNQEKYIREAVQGAFSQTYCPLEIILSDDCSSDQTFKIMEEMARDYQGSHLVNVRKEEYNSGVLSHVLNVANAARGTIFVVAAGDDISLPERTSRVAMDLLPSSAEAYSSDDIVIDGNGVELEWDKRRYEKMVNLHSENPSWVHGATAAYRTAFLKEMPLPIAKVFFEDMVFADLLQLMKKTSIRSNDRLIKYRYHLNNLSERIKIDVLPIEAEQRAVNRWRLARDAKKYCVDYCENLSLTEESSLDIKKRILREYLYLESISTWQDFKVSSTVKLFRRAAATGNLRSAIPRAFGLNWFLFQLRFGNFLRRK